MSKSGTSALPIPVFKSDTRQERFTYFQEGGNKLKHRTKNHCSVEEGVRKPELSCCWIRVALSPALSVCSQLNHQEQSRVVKEPVTAKFPLP